MIRKALQRMDLQLTKILADAFQRRRIQVLVAEKNHLMIRERLIHIGKLGRAQWLRQVDAGDDRADPGCPTGGADWLIFLARSNGGLRINSHVFLYAICSTLFVYCADRLGRHVPASPAEARRGSA